MSSSPKRVRALRSTISQPAAARRAATSSSAARPIRCRCSVIAADARPSPASGRLARRFVAEAARIAATQSCAPPVGFGSLASSPCSPPRRHSPSTASSARPVRVEVDVHRGLPAFSVVGLPDAAVREARERVRAALVNCGFEFPLRRIVANLAPASLRKAGPGLDLAIAAALLTASGQLELGRCARARRWSASWPSTARSAPCPGVLAIAEAARERGAGGDRGAGRERARGGAGRGHRGDRRSRASASSRRWPRASGCRSAAQPMPLRLQRRRRRAPTSPTCAASATCATRSRSPRPAATAC